MNLEGLTEKRNKAGTACYEKNNGEVVAKVCTKCKEVLPLEKFQKAVGKFCERQSKCKDCGSKYYQSNKERHNEYTKNWYQANKERHAEIMRNYYESHKEEYLERQRKWSRSNKEKEAARNRKWRSKNPENEVMRSQRRRSRKQALPDTLTSAEYLKTLEFFGNACALTGRTYNLEQEHAIPQSIGGGYTFENIYPMANGLNQSKGKKNIFEWFEANRQRFNLEQERFDRLIEWLGKANGMTVEEYRDYVYECHANPNAIDDDMAI